MTGKTIPPSTGSMLQATLTGDRETIRRKVRSHEPSQQAREFMESTSAKAPGSASAHGAERVEPQVGSIEC